MYSVADPGPITADTEIEIGSISKVLIALLLAESERSGKVFRSDAAAKYLLPAGLDRQRLSFDFVDLQQSDVRFALRIRQMCGVVSRR